MYALIKHMIITKHITEIIFQDGTEIQAFVAECQGQIVGLSIIRREEVSFSHLQKAMKFH
jgi:hypothetical protein